MKIVFLLARVANNGSLEVLPGHWDTYAEAESAIMAQTPGTYQVQKWFVKA